VVYRAGVDGFEKRKISYLYWKWKPQFFGFSVITINIRAFPFGAFATVQLIYDFMSSKQPEGNRSGFN